VVRVALLVKELLVWELLQGGGVSVHICVFACV
jgi:hypothetical protein